MLVCVCVHVHAQNLGEGGVSHARWLWLATFINTCCTHVHMLLNWFAQQLHASASKKSAASQTNTVKLHVLRQTVAVKPHAHLACQFLRACA